MKLGINAPLFDTIGTAATFKQRLVALHDLDIKYIRLDCHLYNLNTADGVYNVSEMDTIMAALKSRGIEVLLYLVGTPSWNTTGPVNTTDDTWPPANMTKYCDAVIYMLKRYPEVKCVEIWNEQNTTGFWKPAPSVTGYLAMAQAVKTRLAGDSALVDVKIVMGGLAYLGQIDATGVNMLNAMHAITPLQNLFDVANYHPYIDPHNHWTAGSQSIYAACIAQNAWLHDLGIEVWATELGKSTYPTSMPEVFQPHINEMDHANFWAEALSEMKMANFDRVYAFRLDDRAVWNQTDRDAYYGFVRLDGSKKPAYDVLRRFSRGE